jgi:nifR3 family TIM-barrel protein
MAGYTDLTFRLAVRRIGGIDLAFTEMLNPRSLLNGPRRKAMNLMQTCPLDVPLSHQIYGHEPEIMAKGAAWLQRHGATAIDLNFGCPQKKITRRGAGAGVLKDPKRAEAIASAVAAAVDIPVTAKIRLGWDSEHIIAVDLALMLERAGVKAITVHARTAVQGFSGPVNMELLRDVTRAVKVPVVGNGDIYTADDAAVMVEHVGCAGIMVGRQALKNPWIFLQIRARLRNTIVPEPPSTADHVEFMRHHLDMVIERYGPEHAPAAFRCWIPQYARALSLGKQAMTRMIVLNDVDALRAAIDTLAACRTSRQRRVCLWA